MLIIILSSGCSGSGKAGAGFTAGGTGLEGIQLPQLPLDRETATPVSETVYGNEAIEASTNASTDGNALKLQSTGQTLSWGIWQISAAGSELENVQVFLDIEPGDQAYMAVANYSAGSWDFLDPVDGSTTINLDNASHLSPMGNVHIAVVAAGGDQLLVERLIQTTDRTGWAIVRVHAGEKIGRLCNVISLNGKPAVCYLENRGADFYRINYAYSTTELGLFPGDWRIVQVLDHGADLSMHMELIGGNPAIVYIARPEEDVCYTRSTTPTGSQPGDWPAPITVESANNVGSYCRLAEVQGHPAIVFKDNTNDLLRYARSSTPDGIGNGDWSARVTVASSGDIRSSDLAVINGNPTVVYRKSIDHSIHYRRSLTPLGTSAADWNVVAAVDNSPEPIGLLRLETIAGNPAVFHSDLDTRNLYMSRSASTTGGLMADWNLFHTIDDSGDVNIYIDVAMIDGRPAVAYEDYVNRRLVFAHSNSTTGIGPGGTTWQQQTITQLSDESDTLLELSMSEVAGRPVVCYSSANEDDLMYAVLLD
ncbi:hypothetical protein KDL44_03900 [bacterium]|nr:hypothetical protein [bacterium]